MTQTVYRYGGYEGNYTPITLTKPGKYTVKYSYEHYTIPDQFTLRYNGNVLLNTGFVGGSSSGTFKINVPESGGKMAAVVATNNPQTAWYFTLVIDSGPSKPIAVADKYKVGKDDHVNGVSGVAKVLNLAANDTDEDGDIVPSSIKITNGPKNGTVSVNADGTVIYKLTAKHPGSDSFFYTIADAAGNVSDPVKVTIRGDCPDPAPLTITGNLQHLTESDVCVGQDTHDIGIDGGISDLLRIDTNPSGAASRGQVLVFADRIEIRNARIAPLQSLGAPGDALFYGNLTLPAQTAVLGNNAVVTSSALTVVDTSDAFRFHLAGLWFKPTQVQLLPDRLNVAGTFALPDALGSFDIDLPVANGLVFKPDGVSLGGGKITIPNGDFTFFSRVKASWENVSLEYQSVQNTLTFKGKVALQSGLVQKDDGSTAPSGSKITLDFSDPLTGFLRIKDGVPEFNGSFGIGSMVAKGLWGFDELKFIGHTEGGQWLEAGVSFKYIFPFMKAGAYIPGNNRAINVTTVVAFNPNWVPGSSEDAMGIKEFTLGVSNLNIPIPQAPGIFFQDASGSMKNLAPWLTDDISFGGSLKFTLGNSDMKVQADLSEWLGTGPGTSLDGNFLNLTLSGTASVGRADGHFKVNGTAELTVIGDALLKISGAVDADLDAGSIQLKGALTGFAGLMSGEASGKLTLAGQVGVGLAGKVAISFPKIESWGGLSGKQLANANFLAQLSDDGNNSNDFIAAWEQLNVPINYLGNILLTVGAKLVFPGGPFSSPSLGVILRASDVPVVGSWDTVENQQWLMMQSRWTNSIEDQLHLKVLFTDHVTGEHTIIDQDDFDAHGIAVVDPLTSDHAATVMVALPAVGRWDLLLPTEDYDFGTIEIQGWREAADPHLNVTGAGGSDDGNSIDYYGSDLQPGSTVSFYLDADNDGFDGVLIASGVVIDGEVRTFSFTADAPPDDDDGYVYLYSVIDSPNGIPQAEYVNFAIQVLQPTDLHIERQIQDTVADGDYFFYTLVLTNEGSRAAKDVVLTEYVDGGEILDVYVQGGDWERLDNGYVRITVPYDLYQGDQVRIDIYAHADHTKTHDQYEYDDNTGEDADYAEQDFRAEAFVTTRTFEQDKTDNSNVYIGRFADAPTVQPSDSNGDLKVERIFTSDVSGPIGYVTYDLVVTNQGPSKVTGAELTEMVTGGSLSGYFSRALSGPAATIDGQTLKLALPDLESGQKYILPVTFTANEAAELTLQAQVSQAGTDIDHRNDYAIDHLDATVLGTTPGNVDIALRIGAVTEGANGLVLVRLDLVSEGIFTNLASDVQVKLSTGSGLSIVSTDAAPAAGQPVDYSFPTYEPGSGVWALNGAIQGDGQIRSLNVTLHKDDLAGGVFKAELINLREHDVDSTPANGDPTEDDMVVTTIGSVNHAPVLASLVPDYTVGEGQAFSIQLPQNAFIDPDGDQVHYSIKGVGVGTPGNDGGYNNTYVYTPVPSWITFDSDTGILSGIAQSYQYDQAYTIQVIAYDNRGGVATDTFRLAVNDVRTAPEPNKAYPEMTAFVGVGFTYSLPSNIPYDAQRAYWTDGDLYRTIPNTYDYNHYSYEFFSSDGAPSWLGVYGGFLSGVPDAPGVYDLTVVGRNHYYDGQDLDGTQTVRLTVVAIEPPVVTHQIDTQYGTENQPFTLAVPADAFTDPNGDALGYWWTDLPAWLSYDIETGTLSGTPIQGDQGEFDVVLHASDGKLGVAQQTVHFSVANVNDRPQPIQDWYALLPDTALSADVSLNDTDKDNDPLTFALAAGVQHGTLVFNADGTFTYTPEAGFQGADFFTYTANDGQLDSIATRVDLFVQLPPEGVPDSYTARPNFRDGYREGRTEQKLVVDADHGVLANDDLGPNAVWEQAYVVTGTAHGVLSLAHDGSFTYRPDDEFVGIDHFTYRPWDGLAYGAEVDVAITVPFENRKAAGQYDYLNSGNNPATTANPFTFSAAQLLANDDARDGDPLHVVMVRGPKNGTLVDNGDGTYTYTPDDGFRGPEYMVYNPYDPYGKGLYDVGFLITVAAPDAFIDVRDDFYSTAAGTTLTVGGSGVARNDVDPDTSHLWAGDGYGVYYINELLVSGPQHGTLNYFSSNGTFSYTPDAGFTGVDTFVYRSAEYNRPLGDGDQNPDRATVTIYVGSALPDAAPVAVADSYAAQEDVILKVDVAHGVLANDVSNSGHELVAELVQQTTLGRVYLSPYGNFRYEPNTDYNGNPANQNGQDAFTYRVWDGEKFSDPVAVVINVAPVADLPRGGDFYTSVFLNTNYDPQGNLAYQVYYPDQDGGVTTVNGQAANVGTYVQGTYGKLFLGADGSYLWQPNRALPELTALKASQLIEDLYTFTWTNAAGSTTSTFHGQIYGIDDATTLVADHYTTTPNTPLNVYGFAGVLANDIDPDSTPTGAYLVSSTANGTLAMSDSGAFLYTPNLGFVGTDTFSYHASSANPYAPAVQVTIDVQPLVANTPPVASADSYAMVGAGPLVVNAAAGVLANDTDGQNDPFIALLVAGPQHGQLTLNQDGSFTYQANAGFSGSDAFTYRASDGQAASADTQVSITVPANQAPVAPDATRTAAEDTQVTGNLATLASDPDGDALAFSVVVQAQHGLLSVNPNGGYSYTPFANYVGTDSFTYAAFDGRDTDTGVVTITMTAVNDAPVAASISYQMQEDGVLVVQPPGPLANVVDPDGDALTFIALTQPTQGTFVYHPDGSFTYTPPANFFGTLNFQYAATDGTLQSNTALVTITVLPQNDPPATQEDFFTTAFNTPMALAVLANDIDSDGDALTAVIRTDAVHGTLAVQADGTILYTPDAGFRGTDHFEYSAFDGVNLSIRTPVTVVVEPPPNVAPVAHDDSAVTNEDTAVLIDVLANDVPGDDDVLTITIVGESPLGYAYVNADNKITFTPKTDANGYTTFTYRLDDGQAHSDATVTVSIAPVPDAPVAFNDYFGIQYATPTVVNPLAYEYDGDGDTLIFQLVSAPQHGTFVQQGDGTFLYTPDAGYSGADVGLYRLADGTGLFSSVVRMEFSISAPNNTPPHATDGAYQVLEDTSRQGNLHDLANDLDHDPLTFGLITGPAHGALTLDNATGVWTYVPAHDYVGADQFEYSVTDGDVLAAAIVRLTVTEDNDPPVVQNESVQTVRDQPIEVDVLANDSDPEGGALSLLIAAAPNGGNAVVTADHTILFTPTPGFTGITTLAYRVSDPQGAGTDGYLSIEVIAPPNHAPVANDQTPTIAEDTQLTGNLLDFGSDADGDPFTARITGTPDHGQLAFEADTGRFTYTPVADFNGTDSFSFALKDSHGAESTATVSITITPVPDAPAARADATETPEDVPTSGNVLANDMDPDGDSLTAYLAAGTETDTPLGQLTFGADGAWQFVPVADANGTAVFTYFATDGVLSTPATLTIIVGAVNDAPIARPDSATTAEDTQVSGNVALNDTDVDLDPLSFALAPGQDATTALGTLALAADGHWTFTPAADAFGSVVYNYLASDGALSSPSTLTITVTPVNDAPVAVADAALTLEDVATGGNLLANDFDVDSAALTAALAGGVNPVSALGTLALAANGDWTFVPAANAHGTVAYDYVVSDGALSSQATLSITVEAVNDAPTAAADTFQGTEDQPIAGNVLANDSDVDGDALSALLVAGPSHGQLVLNADGSFTYTPDANFHGADGFTYKANDGSADSAVASVTLDVAATNDAPTGSDATLHVTEDTPVSGNLLALLNAADIDGDALHIAGIGTTPLGTFTLDQQTGDFTFTPGANLAGSGQVEVTITDGSTPVVLTLSLDVQAVNDAPVAVADSYTVGFESLLSVAAALGVLANDSDIDSATLSALLAGDVQHGTLALGADGSFIYTPAAGFSGTDQFTYRASDGQAESTLVTVTLQVAGPNQTAPVATDDAATVDEDAVLHGSVAGNDSDPDGDTLSFALLGDATHGTLAFNADGSYSYTPAADFHGTDSFTYRASDGTLTDDATVTITVTPVNDAPAATDDAFSFPRGTAMAGNVLANDSDIDGDALSATLLGGTSHGTVVLQADGQFAYTANQGFVGEDSFTYRAEDGHGGFDEATATITVTAANRAPVAQDDTATTSEDAAFPLFVPALANDSDPDGDPIAVLSFTQGAHGTVTNNGGLAYLPDPDFNGTDSFTYTIIDGFGATATATVTMTVLAANDAPVANDDFVTIAEDSPTILITPLANDTDIDGDILTLGSITQAAHGFVQQNGNQVSYLPDANFNGTDQFTYRVFDQGGAERTATVFITVTPVNDAPVAAADSYTTDAGASLVVTALNGVLANDSDIDSPTLDSVLVTDVAHGTLALSADGSFVYTPAAGFAGTDQFTYRANDGQDSSDPVTVTLQVQDGSLPLPPVAADDAATVAEDAVLIATVAGNDSDPNGDALSFALLTGAAHGTLAFNADGTYSYTPAADFHGTDSFTYRASDGTLTDDATVTITVTPVNDRPVANDDTATAAHNTPVSILLSALLANDSDVDGDALSVAAVASGTGGTAQLVGDHVLFTPNAGFSGAAKFSYTLSDGALSDTAEVTVNVAAAPVGTPSFRFGDGAAGTPLGSTPQPPLTPAATVNQLVQYTPNADGGMDVLMKGAWNAIKWLDLSFTGGPAKGTWAVKDIVALYADFAGGDPADATGIDFTGIGLKRGTVSFGDGGDTVTWVSHSNGGESAGWSELTTINTRGGNDVVKLASVLNSALDEAMLGGRSNGSLWTTRYDGRYSKFTIDLGDGDDQLSMGATDRMRVDVKGGAGRDTITLGAADDRIDGGAGADVLKGGAGNDTFVMHAGEAGGDRILDFTGAGAAGGDLLEFQGYGAGASITGLGGGQYRVSGNGFSDTFTLMNGSQAVNNLAQQDLLFVA